MESRVPSLEPRQSVMHWTEMIAGDSAEAQCAGIAKWLKRYCEASGIALLLQDPRLDRNIFYTETVPDDVLEDVRGILARLVETDELKDAVQFLVLGEGKLTFINEPKQQQSSKSMVLAEGLATERHSIGALAVVAKPAEILSFLDEKQQSSWFGPLISRLLDNSISHEVKDKKIRLLNLYQTISSSLAHVGDLHELLTTIMSIVTSELRCEEGSVLMMDQESNEFEFFTAVGETGQDLEKVRFPADKGIAGRALRERTTLVVNDVASDPDFYGKIDEDHDFQTKSILATPLISGEEIVGVINAINKIGDQKFDRDDAQILAAIADEVALAVKNARLFDYVVNSYCKIRQGQPSCKGCERPLRSWTPCVRQLGEQ